MVREGENMALSNQSVQNCSPNAVFPGTQAPLEGVVDLSQSRLPCMPVNKLIWEQEVRRVTGIASLLIAQASFSPAELGISEFI